MPGDAARNGAEMSAILRHGEPTVTEQTDAEVAVLRTLAAGRQLGLPRWTGLDQHVDRVWHMHLPSHDAVEQWAGWLLATAGAAVDSGWSQHSGDWDRHARRAYLHGGEIELFHLVRPEAVAA
jgi:hypothetical protein